MLAQAGATRLSLHLPAEFGAALARAAGGGDFAVVVHYPERYQVWIAGQELAAWAGEEAGQMAPDARYYGGQLDSYWCVQEHPGRLHVPHTDWPALTVAIAADLEIRIPAADLAPGPVFADGADRASWASLPLFPTARQAAPAHQLLASLYREQARFANDTHPKNESSAYHWMDAAAADRLYAWGRRLDSWLIEVQLRCANECRQSQLSEEATTLLRLHTPAPPESAPETSTQAALPAPAGRVASRDKWIERIGFLVSIVVVTLFVVAVANVIAWLPWLAIPIGLVYGLYAKYKQQPLPKQ
jgi:hypothetical protein